MDNIPAQHDGDELFSMELGSVKPRGTAESVIVDYRPTDPRALDEERKMQSNGQRRTYDRDTLLQIRDAPHVAKQVIELESEISRDLQRHFDSDGNKYGTYIMPSSETLGDRGGEYPIQEHNPSRRDEGWRVISGHRQKTAGSAVPSSPSHTGSLRSLLVDDMGSMASPERPSLAHHKQSGSNWRRTAEVRNEVDEDLRRPGHGRGSTREDGSHDRKLSSSAGTEDAWRPAGPPGLGRGIGQRAHPPGLGSDAERPWGAGRGRLGDGERRVTGKPRDPPGVMPPHEQARDPQLPEGWNRPRNRSSTSDWRMGKVRELVSKNAGKEGAGNSGEKDGGIGAPAWLTADDADEFDALAQTADSKRLEFEAEHKRLRDERAAVKAGIAAGPPVEEISLDEIEAMKLESLAADKASAEAQRLPSRPHSALGIQSLFGETLPPVNLNEPADVRVEAGSRFSRWFKMEPSPSASNLPDATSFSPLPQPNKQPSQPLPINTFPEGQAVAAESMNDFQASLVPRAPSAAGSTASDLAPPQRNLLAQLQAQNSGGLVQALQQQAQGNQSNRAQLDRFLLERNLLSPRNEQVAPGGGIPRPMTQQQQLPAANSSALLSLLQNQQGLSHQDSLGSQLPSQLEPTFANPNPAQQHQQNLLNALNLGNQQQGGAQFSNNLLEQLQRMKLANEQQQKQQQLQQQFQLQQAQQGPAQANANLLAAFSAHMPRDVGAPKQLPEDLFSFNPNQQLQRMSQANLQQPSSLGLGKNDRVGASVVQPTNSLAQLLQSQQLAQTRGVLGQQKPPTSMPNGLYGMSQGNASQLANLRGLSGQALNQNMGKFPQFSQPQSNPQAGLLGQGSQSLGGADPQQIARYLEQQRQTQMLQQLQQQQQQQQHQAQQARIINTQRLYQLQLSQQQAQQQAAQQRAAQAAMLQQQQQQQLQQSRLSNEALIRQQQLIQLQNLQTLQQLQGANNPQTTNSLLGSATDPNALARLFANSGAGLGNLPGRG